MKKYGDMVNGIGRAGFVKSIEVDENGVKYAVVRTELIDRWARVYLIPSVWKENIFPEIGDNVFMGGLVQSENRDSNGNIYSVAGKAIFLGLWSPGYISEIKSWKDDNPFAVVKSSKHGDVILFLSPSVWFEEKFPEKGDHVYVCAIDFVDNKRVAGGGIFVRC